MTTERIDIDPAIMMGKPVIRGTRITVELILRKLAEGASEGQVLERALKEKRVLITEDRDFGELVYARGRSSSGVILVRFPSRARRAKSATVIEAVSKLGSRLGDAFTVVQPGRLRISSRP